MDKNCPLLFQLKSINNQIKRLLEKSNIEGNQANLTGMQYAMLGFLSNRSNHTDTYQKDIEAEFNIRRSTASGMLQRLEKAGYIERVSVADDARLKKIMITKKAEEMDKAAHANIIRLEKRMTKGISEEELETFFDILDRISQNAKE